jgi:glycosyltransferase involved in cell wall biosynthesis
MAEVSVLTTNYNRENYIGQCIESVLTSSFHDWEMIIVDDCSSDKSVLVAREFEKKDLRIKVYVNDKNLGDYSNRNKAASYATGKYLKFLDADDMIYPHGLEIFVKTMEQFPEAALGISQEVAEDFRPYPFLMYPHETFVREFLQRGVLGLGPTGTIIRRDIFEKLGGFTGTRFIGDTEMWFKISANYPVVKTFPGLVYWRRHENQEINLGYSSNFYLQNNYKLKKDVLNMEKSPLNEFEKKIAVKRLNCNFGRSILNLGIKQLKPISAWKLLCESPITFMEMVKSLI